MARRAVFVAAVSVTRVVQWPGRMAPSGVRQARRRAAMKALGGGDALGADEHLGSLVK
jgi:hypothetical protein